MITNKNYSSFTNVANPSLRAHLQKPDELLKADSKMSFKELMMLLIKSNNEEKMIKALNTNREGIKPIKAEEQSGSMRDNNDPSKKTEQSDRVYSSGHDTTLKQKQIEASAFKLTCKLLGLDEEDYTFL